MKKIYSFALAAVAVLAASSCSNLEPLTSDNFTCDPNPLVEIGGSVDATVTVTYPVKYFDKKATVDVTPVLVWEGGEAKSETLTYQGEKVKGNDEVIQYKYGGTYTIRCHFDYVPEMAKSELYIDYIGHIGKKDYTFDRIKVADGVIATETMASAAEATPAYSADHFVKDTFDKYIATLIYGYQSTSLNAKETKKDEVKNVENMVKATLDEERREFEGIEMLSTASPEGAVSLNEKLAAGREKSSNAYLQQFFKKAKMEANVTPEQVAENWNDFKTLVENSNIQDKNLVLSVLGRISDPDAREREIKNLSAAYKELADEILPQLRYSKLTATVRNVGHSDEEILSLLASTPDSLTLEELLYAAKMQNEDSQKLNTYRIATNRFPEDTRAANNAAGILFKQGKVDEAKKTWEGVLAKNANNSQANMNLGLIAVNEGNYEVAESYLGKAGSCEEYGETYGTLLTRKGKYAQAINAFGAKKCNNLAVAQICAGKYNDAKSTLETLESKNATTYYLLAVVAARTNNASAVSENLQQAVKLDSSMKSKAATDAEFAKYSSAVAAL